MTPERWQRIDEIFQAAIELSHSERVAFLDSSCSNDQELRREVESLITSDEQGLSLIDAPAFEAVAGVFADDRSELEEGQRIAHYKILALLGKGGMGEVYLAEDTELGRKIAIKLLPAEFIRDKERLRRIKPDNIMLRRDGYVKVLDFGLAKLTEQQEATNEAQAADDVNISSGLVMGTVKYMSPEQAQRLQVDTRSDIFSFGAVLYEMLAGRTPFEGETASELIAAILKREPPPLTAAALSWPRERREPDLLKSGIFHILRAKCIGLPTIWITTIT